MFCIVAGGHSLLDPAKRVIFPEADDDQASAGRRLEGCERGTFDISLLRTANTTLRDRNRIEAIGDRGWVAQGKDMSKCAVQRRRQDERWS